MGNKASKSQQTRQPEADHVHWTLAMTLNDGMKSKYDSFTREVSEMTKKNEDGAIGYEFFLGEDKKTLHIYEHYVTSDDVLIHVENIGGKTKLKQGGKVLDTLLAIASPTSMTVYGNPNDKAKDALAGFNPVYFHDIEMFMRGNGTPAVQAPLIHALFGKKHIAATVSDLGIMHWIVKVNLKEGKLDELKAVAKERIEYIQQNEKGMLGLSFHVSEDGKKLHIYQRYEDAASAATYFNAIADDLKNRISAMVDLESMEIDVMCKASLPGDFLRKKLSQHGPVTYLSQTGGFTRF